MILIPNSVDLPFQNPVRCEIMILFVTFIAWKFIPSNSLITYSMEQSPWKANSRSASQEIPSILCNQKVHFHVHRSLPLIPTFNQMNLVHTIISCFFKIHSNIILQSKRRSFKWSVSFRFSYQKFLCISPLSCVCHMPPISSFLISSP